MYIFNLNEVIDFFSYNNCDFPHNFNAFKYHIVARESSSFRACKYLNTVVAFKRPCISVSHRTSDDMRYATMSKQKKYIMLLWPDAKIYTITNYELLLRHTPPL